MSYYVANGTGLLNTAATWDLVRNTPTIHASSNTSVTTGGIKTVGFTAPNTTNAATGVAIYVATYPSAGINFTATLEESGVAKAATTTTFLQTDMPTTAGWIYFKLTTPYVYTTTTASAYKWIIKSTTSNGGALAEDSGGSNPAYLSTENTNAAPTTDLIYILSPNGNTAITVTVDGTSGSITGGTYDFVAANTRKMGVTTCIVGGSATASNALLTWDTTASSKCIFSSTMVISDGGELRMGTDSSPYPAPYIAELRKTSNGATVAKEGAGIINMVGTALTYYKTSYVSGTGEAADPLIVSDPVDWTVGDYIAVTATSSNATNYNETEYKYIITKNSTTSYVLSDTSGGSENAFTYTHNTNAKVLNLTRNVIFGNTGSSGFSKIALNGTVSAVIKWVSFLYLGEANSSVPITNANGLSTSPVYPSTVDYCCFGVSNCYAFMPRLTVANTYTGNIFYGGQVGSANTLWGQLAVTGAYQTFVDHFFIGNARQGVQYAGTNCTFTNPYFSGNNTNGTANNGSFYAMNGSSFTMTTPNMHCSRGYGFVLAGSSGVAVSDGEIGSKGANQTTDVYIISSTANSALFTNTNFGSTTLVSGHTTGSVGQTLIRFDTLNNTPNNHKWYTEYGSASSSGAGLSDTTVRTSATLNVRMAPEDSTTGFSWSYKVLAVPSKAVYALGFIERNAAFAADDCIVELFLPGSTVADVTYTMPTTVGSYLPYILGATYSGTVSRFATVKITAKTTTASAYCYVADIFNGTNNITNLNTWDNGQPPNIMYEQLGDAAAVWAVPLSTLTTTGTTGKKQVDNLTYVQSLQ